MKKSIKIALVSLLAALSAWSLCACSSASESGTATDDTASSQEAAIEVIEGTTVPEVTVISYAEAEAE